mgnify:CR=1 FL=1|tara:strand:- start:544 stop:828 length:285 start_codon:yes stop_codon:yes gene_type:complete
MIPLKPTKLYTNEQIFEASSSIFGGFRAIINVNQYGSLNSILLQFKNLLCDNLKSSNFQELIKLLDTQTCSLYNITIDEIQSEEYQKVFYIIIS